MVSRRILDKALWKYPHDVINFQTLKNANIQNNMLITSRKELRDSSATHFSINEISRL